MATLYSQTSSNTNSNFNWNWANDAYAWSFVPSATGIPTQIILNVASITGTPTGNFYIKASNLIASATYWTAIGVTLSAWDNTITLTGWSSITSWGTYWVYFDRTSSSANVPAISYSTALTNYPVYRSLAANNDPTTLWFTNDIRMQINWWTTAWNSSFLMFC